MFNLFFAIIFIAELVIVLFLILKIYSFNKYVNNLNSAVVNLNGGLKETFSILTELLKAVSEYILELKKVVKKKREDYILKAAKKYIMYSSVIFIKGKWSSFGRAAIAYHIGRGIVEGIKEG